MRKACAVSAVIAMLAVATSGSISHAQPEEPSADEASARLATVGTWDFEATPNSLDENPQCRETWQFADDGTGWVQSDQQRVTNNWRVLIYRARYPAIVVYRTPLSSNSGPDCLNDTIDPDSYPREERGFILTFLGDGSARVCGAAEFQHSFDGKRTAPLIGGREDCWGILRPATSEM